MLGEADLLSAELGEAEVGDLEVGGGCGHWALLGVRARGRVKADVLWRRHLSRHADGESMPSVGLVRP